MFHKLRLSLSRYLNSTILFNVGELTWAEFFLQKKINFNWPWHSNATFMFPALGHTLTKFSSTWKNGQDKCSRLYACHKNIRLWGGGSQGSFPGEQKLERTCIQKDDARTVQEERGDTESTKLYINRTCNEHDPVWKKALRAAYILRLLCSLDVAVFPHALYVQRPVPLEAWVSQTKGDSQFGALVLVHH